MKKSLNLHPINNELLELRIKEVAKDQGVTMKVIAEKTGITKSYLSRINSGRINPSFEMLQNIANTMNVPVHRLIVTPEGYAHFEVDGEWHGIRKK